MKTLFNFLFAAWLAFMVFGCAEKGSIVEAGATNEYSALTLTGKVSPWAMGSGVELKLAEASGKIGSDGSFSISVPAPDKSQLKPITGLSETELSVSDPSAKYLIASPKLYANGEFFGILEWSSEFNGGTVNAKYCKAVYFFSDKDVTVSGASYGFTARAGWNTLYVYENGGADFYYSDAADMDGRYEAVGVVQD